MATTLLDIKRRIGSTSQIRRVTATLQRVAAAKLTRDLQRIADSKPYFTKICELLQTAHTNLPFNAAPHPFMQKTAGNKTALVIFGSDRGLCGTFNTELMEQARQFLTKHNQTIHLFLRGKVIHRRAMRLKMQPVDFLENAELVASSIPQDFLNKRFDRVFLMYWEYKDNFHQQIITRQLLPTPFISSDNKTSSQPDFLIEPDPQSIIDTLLPEYIRCSIHNANFHSLVSEHVYRRDAMSRATHNAGDMLTALRKQYSRVRQENITTEMLEIISGLTK